MAAKIRIILTETGVDVTNNKSTVKAAVQYYGNGISWGFSPRRGELIVNNKTYSFTATYTASQSWQTLAVEEGISIIHDDSGEGIVEASAKFYTGTSIGTLTTTAQKTLTPITRKWNYVFDANGGAYTPSVIVHKYNVPTTLPSAITRTGYSFMGWQCSVDGSIYPAGAQVNINAECTFTATWRVVTSYVTYDANGHGTAPDRVTLVLSATIKAADAITGVVGYIFKNWNTAKDGSGTAYLPGAVIKEANVFKESFTLYAQWIANSDTAYFNANGGVPGTVTSKPVTYQQKFTFPTAEQSPTREYCRFLGWATAPDGVKLYSASQEIIWNYDGGITFYAVWETTERTVYLYKNKDASNFALADNYEISSTVTANAGSKINLEGKSVPNLDDYLFSTYWSMNNPLATVFTRYGHSYPAGVVPYNFSLDEAKSAGLIESKADAFTLGTENINLYPVYRDNTTSDIVYIESNFQYVERQGVPTTESLDAYFRYLTNKVGSFSIKDRSAQIYAYYKFKVNNDQVPLVVVNSDIILATASSGTTITTINTIKKSVENNVTYYYLLIANSAEIDQTESYNLTITKALDGIGKKVAVPAILISPPIVMMDFFARNSAPNSSSVGVFTNARENGNNNIIDVDGEINTGLSVVYEAPTAANPYGIKICILQTAPATMYDGWLYLIEDGSTPTPTPPVVDGAYYIVKTS